jgi:hypothetical protein
MKTYRQLTATLPYVRESVIPKNSSYGFLGTAGEGAHELLDKAVKHVKDANKGNKNFQMSDVTIGHFLDSVHGRHLADMMVSKQPDDIIQRSVKAAVTHFSKTYNPQLFESFLDFGQGTLNEADMHTRSDISSVYAQASSAAGRAAAAKRRAADKAAREKHLAAQNPQKDEPKKEEPKKKPEAKVPHSDGTVGIHSSNPIKKDKAIGEIRKLDREKLHAHEASKKLMPHTDDSKLHKQIKSFADMAPDTDVRPVVRKRMKELKIRGF